MTLPPDFPALVEGIVGRDWVRRDPDALLAYGTDALKKGQPADLVALPANTREIAAMWPRCAIGISCRSSCAAAARATRADPFLSRAASSSASSG